MPLPTNIQTYLDTWRGVKDQITQENFSNEELTSLRDIIKRKAEFNKTQQWNLENMYLDTPSEYRRSPETKLVTTDGKRFTGQEKDYSERQQQIQDSIKSYKKNPNKISVSYGDYNVKSGENAAPVDQGWLSALSQSFTDPAFRLASTLGSFNAYDEGNQYRVEDKYKFNNDQQWYYKNASSKPLLEIVKQYWDRPGSLGEILFNKYRPGQERQVNFKVSK